MKCNVQEMKAFLNKIDDWQLKIDPQFLKYTPEQLTKIFNGVGPDSWSEELRNALSIALEHFLPAVVIHDFDYDVLAKTETNFKATTNRIRDNCLICSNKEYPEWYQFLQRWFHRRQAKLVYLGCKYGGRSAFFN